MWLNGRLKLIFHSYNLNYRPRKYFHFFVLLSVRNVFISVCSTYHALFRMYPIRLYILFLLIFSFVLAYFFFLFSYEKHFATSQKAPQMMQEEVEGFEQVITMEEDGRLGNLLMEMATLLLIGREANVSVSLLPQVDHAIICHYLIIISTAKQCS